MIKAMRGTAVLLMASLCLAVPAIPVSAVEEELLDRDRIGAMVMSNLTKELEPMGFSGVQIRFAQFPDRFSYPAGSQMVITEMAGHRRLGIRRYKITAMGERGVRKTAFCAAAVSAEGPEIRAHYHIPAGKRIAQSDLVVTRKRIEDMPTDAVTDVAQIVDQEANRNIAQGERIESDFVRQPFAITRGEVIEVEVNLGAVEARVFAEAQSSGFVGDRIPFKNTLSLKRFDARITGPRKARTTLSEGE